MTVAYFSELISCPSAYVDHHFSEDNHLETIAFSVPFTWNSLSPALSMAGFFWSFWIPLNCHFYGEPFSVIPT